MHPFLQASGLSSEQEFYSRYPTEEAFFKDFPHMQTGGYSELGYLPFSPDVNNAYNVIPSSEITMQGVQFPVLGMAGNDVQMMYPGGDYRFNGTQVTEYPVLQTGGKLMGFNNKTPITLSDKNSVDKINGLPKDLKSLANVQAEAGEVVRFQDGQIGYLDPSLSNNNNHSKGDAYVSGAESVLEATSTKKNRNGVIDKALRIKPEVAEEITGFKPKAVVSHATLFNQASEYFDKHRGKSIKAAMKAIEKDSIGTDKLAQNSVKMNAWVANQYPTSEELYENLFSHQEQVKADVIKAVESNPDITDKMPLIAKAQHGGFIPKAQVGSLNNLPQAEINRRMKLAYDRAVKNGYAGKYANNYSSDLESLRNFYRYQNVNIMDMLNNPSAFTSFDQPGVREFLRTDGTLGTYSLDSPTSQAQVKELPGVTVTANRSGRAGRISPVSTSTTSVRNIPGPAPVTANPNDVITGLPQSVGYNIAVNNNSEIPIGDINLPPQLPWVSFDTPSNSMYWRESLRRHLGLGRMAEKVATPQLRQQYTVFQNNLPAMRANQAEYNAALAQMSGNVSNMGAAANLLSKKFAQNNQANYQTAVANNQNWVNTQNANTQIMNQQSMLDADAANRLWQQTKISMAKQDRARAAVNASDISWQANRDAFETNFNLDLMKFNPYVAANTASRLQEHFQPGNPNNIDPSLYWNYTFTNPFNPNAAQEQTMAIQQQAAAEAAKAKKTSQASSRYVTSFLPDGTPVQVNTETGRVMKLPAGKSPFQSGGKVKFKFK